MVPSMLNIAGQDLDVIHAGAGVLRSAWNLHMSKEAADSYSVTRIIQFVKVRRVATLPSLLIAC
jgi:hypothetical protein